MTGPAVATITIGTRLVYEGEAYTVAGMEAGRLMLRSARGKRLLVHTAIVLADPSTRLPGAGEQPAAACGPLLDSLTGPERGGLADRLHHLRELLTGYVSGTASAARRG